MSLVRRRITKYVPAFLFIFVLALVPHHALAQSINLDLGQGPTTTAKLIQLMLLITVISLAPSILVMVTCFTRVIVVLSFLRTALGTSTTPPNVVLISLAIFLTMFIMQPTFEKAWEDGLQPLMNNQLDESTAFDRTVEPFHDFMLRNARPKDVKLFMDAGKIGPNDGAEKGKTPPLAAAPGNKPADKATDGKNPASTQAASDDIPLRALIPA